MAVACLAASACAPRPDPHQPSSVVRVGVVAPSEAGQGRVIGLPALTENLVTETLVSIGPTGEIEPRLAERWEQSADGKTWRFYLKPGVRFHNGALLTSSLVLPALKRDLSLIHGARAVALVDERTFEIVQDKPSRLLLDTLIEVPISTADETTSATGPFMAAPEDGDRVTVGAFDSHHRGRPSIRNVGFQQYSDQRKAWAALMRAEIDVLYEVSPEARDFVETESTVSVSAFLRPYTILLGFNLSEPTFKSRDIRRALNLAIDRTKVIKTALRGHGQPAYDPLWPRHWAVDASRSAYAPDKPAARRLLEASGRTLRPSSAGRMPSRLSFHCLVYAPLEKFALAIQRELALIDVDMSVELLPVREMGRRLSQGEYEAFLFELTNVRSIGYTYVFWHSKSPRSVRTGYSAADEALDQMRFARNDEETKAGVRAVQDVMKDDPPAIFIAYPEMARAVSRRFEIPSSEEDIFHTIARWKPARR